MKKRIAKKFWKEFHRLNPGYDFKVKIMPAVPRGSYGWPTLKRAVKRWNTAVALHKRCRARKPRDMGKWEVQTFTWIQNEGTGDTNESVGSWAVSRGGDPNVQASFQATLGAHLKAHPVTKGGSTPAVWVGFHPGDSEGGAT